MMSLKQNPRVRRTAQSLFMREALLFIIDKQPRDAQMFTRLGDGARDSAESELHSCNVRDVIHLLGLVQSAEKPKLSRTRRLTLAFFRHNFIRYSLTKRCRAVVQWTSN